MNGRIARGTALVFMTGLMVGVLKVSGKTAKGMGRECKLGQMVRDMKVNGKANTWMV